MISLSDDESIITAFAEHADGPGWHNHIITVIITNQHGQLRMASLQPDEQSAAMRTLFDVSNSVHVSMTDAIQAQLESAQKGTQS